ncbi:MAG: cupin domain-containing protein [Candidatus Obscuribacterales bacterium]
MTKTVTDLIASLDLKPHPEGGYYRETYRSNKVAGEPVRALSTAIYYLLVADTFSELHRLTADEIFHFYLGDTVEMLQLFEDGSSKVVKLGQNLAAGEKLQVVLPTGVWFGSRLLAGGTYALMGTTVAPGFDFADYERGNRAELIAKFSQSAESAELTTITEMITALTRG